MDAKIKLLGHPVHPMVVAYPIAGYTGTLVGFIVFAATKDLFWLKLTIAVNVAGVAAALAAALPGFIDWAFGIPKGTPARRTGLIHLLLNVSALVLFAVSLIIYIGDWNGPSDVSAVPGIILAFVGVGLTIAAGFRGWALIQDHHVGVNMTEEQRRVDERREGLRSQSE